MDAWTHGCKDAWAHVCMDGCTDARIVKSPKPCMSIKRPNRHESVQTRRWKDLIDRMLVYDHAERILPREAMEHPFFAPLKER